MIKTKLLVAAFLGGFFVPTFAAEPNEPPEDFTSYPVRMLLHCTTGGLGRIAEVLAESWQEVPVVMSRLSRTSTFILFVSAPPHNTSTLVVSKTTKDGVEACVVWSGSSVGESFSVAPSPVWPNPKPKGTDI